MSTGPRSDDGRRRSRANAVKHGLTGTGTALPGAITDRVQGFEMALRTEHAVGEGDAVGRFLVAQAALAMARMEVAPLVEFDLRREQVDRAEHSWDLDRARDAAALGDRLARRPAVVAMQLLQTAPGCDWLLARLDLLASSIEAAGSADDSHRRMLGDLIGLPAELREADPRLSPDRTADELAALAREERDAVARLKAEIIDPRDDRERERTQAGLAFDESPAARRLRGYEAACDRRLRWATDQLRRRRAALPVATPAAPPRSSLSWPTAPVPRPSPRPEPSPAAAAAAPPPSPALPSAASGTPAAPPADGPSPKTNPTAGLAATRSTSSDAADGPSPKTNPTAPARPAPPPSDSGRSPAASPASAPPRPAADPLEKRTQPALAPRPMATADRPVLLNNRRSRRAAAARARRAG